MMSSLFVAVCLLRFYFEMHGEAWPFSNCELIGGILICALDPQMMPDIPYVPGALHHNGNDLYSTTDIPPLAFHGTDIEGGLQMCMERKMRPCSELGQKPHWPDGVYFYGDKAIADESDYNQGCQIRVQLFGISISKNAANKYKQGAVIFPMLFRMERSARKRHGARGVEWVANTRSIRMETASLDCVRLTAFLKDWVRVQIFLLGLGFDC